MFILWLGCKIKVSIAFINERVVEVSTIRCILLLFLLLLLVLTNSMKNIKYFRNIKLTNGLGKNSITNNNNKRKIYKMNTFAQYLDFRNLFSEILPRLCSSPLSPDNNPLWVQRSLWFGRIPMSSLVWHIQNRFA